MDHFTINLLPGLKFALYCFIDFDQPISVKLKLLGDEVNKPSLILSSTGGKRWEKVNWEGMLWNYIYTPIYTERER